MIIKKISIPSNILDFLFFVSINKNKFIVLQNINQNKMYLKIPNNILIEKQMNTLLISSGEENILFLLEKKILDLFKNKDKVYYARLSLRGLGFKITKVVENSNTFLLFKVGFSNLIKIKEPSDKLSTNIRKSKLYLFSSNLVFLGNFSKIIKNIKKPNPYNGKGIFLKNSFFKKKIFKKK